MKDSATATRGIGRWLADPDRDLDIILVLFLVYFIVAGGGLAVNSRYHILAANESKLVFGAATAIGSFAFYYAREQIKDSVPRASQLLLPVACLVGITVFAIGLSRAIF